jgi:[citrate (pro-3S)-lyase] ligase
MGFETSDFRIEVMDITSSYDIKLVKEFLAELNFDYTPDQVEYSMILYNLNNQVIGTGSSLKGVLKFVAVAPEFRETSAFAQIVTHLNNKILASGYKTVFVYTKPESSIKFQGLGFREIAVVKPLYAFLEFGYCTIEDYKKYLRSLSREAGNGSVAAIVVNCNPFTRGHQYLVEKAASENDRVYVFVVEEDFSVFPFKTRFELIRRGTEHLDNVVLVRGGKYCVSGATFPSYFLKNESADLITQNQTELDVTVFSSHIAPVLGIEKRYVGTEVYCHTTAAYNEAMKKVLPPAGIELMEVERKTIDGVDNYISASKVRAAIREGKTESVKDFLPPTTYEFLKSPEAEAIISKIKAIDGRH